MAQTPAQVLQYIYRLPRGVYLIRSLVPEADLRVVSLNPGTAFFSVLAIQAVRVQGQDEELFSIEPPAPAILGQEQMRYQDMNVHPPYLMVRSETNIATSHACVGVPLFVPAGGSLWARGCAPMDVLPLVEGSLGNNELPATVGAGPALRHLTERVLMQQEAAAPVDAPAQIPADT